MYISSVVRACEDPDSGIISAILFGSAATGSYSPEISDVDLLIVLHDGATAEDRRRVRDTISDHEDRSGVRKQHPDRPGALDAFADRVTANVRSFFVCTRADLLSGDPARILGISALQAFFVDRVAIPSILASGLTFWDEHYYRMFHFRRSVGSMSPRRSSHCSIRRFSWSWHTRSYRPVPDTRWIRSNARFTTATFAITLVGRDFLRRLPSSSSSSAPPPTRPLRSS